jgi:hypothetical protein
MKNRDDDGQRSLFREPKKPAEKKEPMLYIIPANTRSSKCRGENCGKVVYWHYNKTTGRPVIVDCNPVYPENHKTKPGEDHPSRPKCFPPIHPMAPGAYTGHGMDGQGIDHHATCADAKQFGRKTERKNGP